MTYRSTNLPLSTRSVRVGHRNICVSSSQVQKVPWKQNWSWSQMGCGGGEIWNSDLPRASQGQISDLWSLDVSGWAVSQNVFTGWVSTMSESLSQSHVSLPPTRSSIPRHSVFRCFLLICFVFSGGREIGILSWDVFLCARTLHLCPFLCVPPTPAFNFVAMIFEWAYTAWIPSLLAALPRWFVCFHSKLIDTGKQVQVPCSMQ